VRWDRFVLDLVLAARRLRARRRGETRRPPRVAGLLPVRDYDDEVGAAAALRALCDVLIVLDDGSAAPFPHAAICDERIRLDRHGPWNDAANRTLLLYRAFVHGCDWAVFSDDDLVFDAGFQTRDDVARVVAELEAARREVYRFAVRDLWGSETQYRTDGVWGRKSIAVLRRNWFAYPGVTLRDPSLRLHTAAFPANRRARQRVDDRRVAYHTGCWTAERRRARVERYRREDPDGRFQRDYDYMLDERELALAPVPAADLAILRARLARPAAP
jgi:hypothetical protein